MNGRYLLRHMCSDPRVLIQLDLDRRAGISKYNNKKIVTLGCYAALRFFYFPTPLLASVRNSLRMVLATSILSEEDLGVITIIRKRTA